ncbi:MAG TPA: FtsX-like permease family protein [Candidatus Angelobacter sp.]|jgi:putative ABC transport system permease protein
MSRTQLLLRLLLKAAWVRKDRAFTALISVAVVATIATAALTIYADLEGRLSRDFRGFGANVVATHAQGSLTQNDLAGMLSVVKAKQDVVPVAYAIATAPNGSRVIVGGADLGSLAQLNSWWAMKQVSTEGSTLIGSRAAEQLSPSGQPFTVSFGSRTLSIHPQTIFTSGSDDDSRIYVSLNDLTNVTGLSPNVALLRVEGRTRDIEQAIRKLKASAPELDVQPVRQITQAQTAIVGKTRSVVLASSAVVVILIMLCMVATFTSSVLERRKDFAVMKALGASNRTVNLLFASESSLLALVGSIAGYILGSGIAFWIGKANFEAAILPQPVLFLPVLLGSVLLALIASTAPLRLLQQIQPAGILRGE